MITMLFTADSMGDFLNKAEFIQNIIKKGGLINSIM